METLAPKESTFEHVRIDGLPLYDQDVDALEVDASPKIVAGLKALPATPRPPDEARPETPNRPGRSG